MARRLTQKALPPLYFFIGDNRWEKDQALTSLQDKTPSSETRVFDAADRSSSWEELLGSLRTFPLPSRSQLFVLKEADRCPPKIQERLAAALEELPRQNIVVLDMEERPSEGSFLEPLLATAEVRSFQSLRREQLPAWMAARAQGRGKRLLRESALELLERAGDDLFFLDSAIEQLALYVGEREVVTLEDVRQLIGPLLFRTGFELARAIGRREVREALKLLSQLSPHEKLQALVGSMGWSLRRLWQVKQLEQKGCSKEDIARRIGLRWEEREAFLEATSSFKEEEVKDILERLLRLDADSKTGRVEEAEVLESFILSLVEKPGEFSREA